MKVSYCFYLFFFDYFISFLFIIATSALDNESEKIVQEALDRAAEGVVYHI